MDNLVVDTKDFGDAAMRLILEMTDEAVADFMSEIEDEDAKKTEVAEATQLDVD